MLLSPLSLDSNNLPGQVPAPPSSGAGAAGFAEQLQLAAAIGPADAPAPVTLPINSGDAANAIPPAPPIAFHSTTELNLRGVLFSSIVSDPGPQAVVSAAGAPETPAALLNISAGAPAPATPAGGPRADRGAAPQTGCETNVPAADVKPQEKIAPVLHDAAPAIEEAPIPASGLPQKTSTPRVERKHEPKASDTPDALLPQPAAAIVAPIALPVHVVLPVSPRFSHPLTPLGNRIPVAAFVAAGTPVRAETPAADDPFHNDADPKASVLPAEATKPLVATADQLAFAAKVQLAKPQTIPHRPSETSSPAVGEPVRHEPHSQQHSSHRDSDSQFSMKQDETAAKPVVRSAHATSTFEVPATVADEPVTPGKPGFTASARPASTAAAAIEDITPTRPEVPAAPMKDISVRIQSEQGENVDVRILHRAGDVQIAVKSASGETTQGLRHGLSELSDRLNTAGYQADTWHPGQPATAAQNTGDSGNPHHSQQQQSQGDSQSHSGWSQQQGGRRDDHQSNRPRWIEELESNISSSPETGLFHGLIR